MGIEYRDRTGRQRRRRRRERREEDVWASQAGPVEIRRLDDEHRGEAGEEQGGRDSSSERIEDQDQGQER